MQTPQTHLTIHTRAGLIARFDAIRHTHAGDFEAAISEAYEALLAHINDPDVTAAQERMWA